MSSELSLRAEGLSKRYRLGVRERAPETLAGALAGWLRRPLDNLRDLRSLSRFEEGEEDASALWALRDVGFEVRQGEVVGVIGRNGAGKSTLLKILSRITTPTSGRAELHGRVTSLLEVGTGFHQELSGRENVFLNGVILGMTRREVESRFDEIVEFSGVERFLDTPIKRYSSGMKVRLAFAVAAHLQAEILLIDEVLAVGDAAFQRKCLGKMDEVARSGRTVLFVSHQMGAVDSLCERCLYLSQGRLVDDGPTDAVLRRYLTDIEELAGQRAMADRPDRRGSGRAVFTSFTLADPESGRPLEAGVSGTPLLFRIGYRVAPGERLEAPQVNVKIHTGAGAFLSELTNYLTGDVLPTLEGEGFLDCSFPRCPWMSGRYRVSLVLLAREGLVDLLWDAAFFEVQAGDYYGHGVHHDFEEPGVFLDHRWSGER